jgi:hypothetical protein
MRAGGKTAVILGVVERAVKRGQVVLAARVGGGAVHWRCACGLRCVAVEGCALVCACGVERRVAQKEGTG